MRIVQILVVLGFVAGAAALLAWRPATALGLAMAGGATSLAVMKPAPARARRRRSRSAEAVVPAVAVAETPDFRPDPVLLERIRGAGWSVQLATRGAPWLIASQASERGESVRVAIRTAPRTPRATGEDIAEALSAKASERATYVAVICALRPEDHVAERAKHAQVHLINLGRLEAYLTLAGSFRPSPAQVPEAVPA